MCLSHLVLSPYPGSLVSLRLFSNLFPLSPWLPACFSPSLCPSLSLPSPHTIFFPSLPRPAPSPSARRLSEGADGVAGSRRRPQAGVSPDGPVGGVGVPRRHHDDQGAHLRVLLYLQEAGGLLELGGLVHVGHGHTHDRLVAERAQVSEAGVHELVERLQDHGVHGLGLEVQALVGRKQRAGEWVGVCSTPPGRQILSRGDGPREGGAGPR